MSSQKIALVHLVGAQPMPNLLGFLAVRPALCVQVVPSDSQRRAQALTTALATALPEVAFESVDAPASTARTAVSGEVLRRSVGAEIAALRDAGYTPVVNATGDGSPAAMAFLAGAMDAQARILYVDTKASGDASPVFDPVASVATAVPSEWADSARVTEALSPALIAAAHGAQLGAGPREPELFLECALQMAAFGPKQWAALREVLPEVPSGKLPEKLLEMADKPVYLPAFAQGLEAAGLACGIFRRSGSGTLHLAMPEEGRESLLLLARERAAFVKFSPEEWKFRMEVGLAGFHENYDFLASGGWFEVLVWDHVRRSDRFRHALWNPLVTTPRGAEVVPGVFAQEGLNLAAFSCRLGGIETGLPSVAGELARTAARLGGAGATKYLALALQPQALNELLGQTGAHGVRVIGDSRAFRADSERDPFAGFKLLG